MWHPEQLRQFASRYDSQNFNYKFNFNFNFEKEKRIFLADRPKKEEFFLTQPGDGRPSTPSTILLGSIRQGVNGERCHSNNNSIILSNLHFLSTLSNY